MTFKSILFGEAITEAFQPKERRLRQQLNQTQRKVILINFSLDGKNDMIAMVSIWGER